MQAAKRGKHFNISSSCEAYEAQQCMANISKGANVAFTTQGQPILSLETKSIKQKRIQAWYWKPHQPVVSKVIDLYYRHILKPV